MNGKPTHPSWRINFPAIVRYELLWNIRKKKFLGVFVLTFVLATVVLVLPVIFNKINNLTTKPNPDYVITTGTGIPNILFFFFALVSVMNSISGEFESGSIIPLLTKPISRTTIYLGKIFAAFLTVLGAYILLIIYMAAGGYIIYGPQNNLHLVFLTLLGIIISTLVWMSIVLAAGSLSKSSMLAALLGIGVWFGLNVASSIISQVSNQAWIATFAPGSGASGTIGTPGPISAVNITMISSTTTRVSTGTDSIAPNLITYVLNSTTEVGFYRAEITGTGLGLKIKQVLMYTEPLSLIVARSIVVAAVYILLFNFIAWFALKRAQITE
jgi:ABC-type transport system involved in multi-copper enzyme maturation permease subunit